MRPAVLANADFARIQALPRRTVSAADAEAWSRVFTAEFARRPGAVLRPWQAAALGEAALQGGLFAALPVGTGKTLLAELLPAVLGSSRSVLIVPAALREKTFADRAALRADWRLPPTPPTLLSREELALEAQSRRLYDLAPDLIVIDEGDDFSNPASAAVRRVDRYVRAVRDGALDSARRSRHGGVRVCILTGTPARKSLLGYWHLLCWSLDDGAPVPLAHVDAETWAAAIDLHNGRRPALGPLGPNVPAARAWFRARLAETPGVLLVDEDSAGDVPLTVRQRLAREDATLDDAFRVLLVEGENPAGIPITDDNDRNALSRSRLEAQTGCGLVTYWDPPPPPAWREARRAFARFVRARIAATAGARVPLDTERQVIRAHADHPVVRAWLAVKDTFEPRTRTRWLSSSALDSALDWLADDAGAPGIVWTGSVAFGERLAKRAGLRYYGRLGQTAGGEALLHAPHGRSLVASWPACKKGFNLQPWARHLIVMPPPSAKWLEQIIGRSHRAGQSRAVTVDVLVTSGAIADAFEAALAEAAHVADTATLRQKILRASILRASPEINPSNRFRWATKENRDNGK